MKKKVAKVIVLTNQKGGCGKTTITVQLASGLAKAAAKVLVVDADQQHTARNWASGKEALFGFQTTILPASQRVEQLVAREKHNYDFIIIDCPPVAGSIVTYGALLVAGLAIIPLLCSANDLWALTKIIATIKESQRRNQLLQVRILLNQYRPREKLTAGILSAVQSFQLPLLRSRLGARAAFRESAAAGVSVFELPDRKARAEVESLRDEIKELSNEEAATAN